MTAPPLSFDREDGKGRLYRHPNNAHEVPSITNITAQKAKGGLPYYYAREAATFAAKNLEVLGKLDEKARIDLVRGAPNRTTDAASDAGTIVHRAIEDHIKTKQRMSLDEWDRLPKNGKQMMQQFYALEKKYQPRWVDAEFTVWNDTVGYAGTADWSAVFSSGVLCLGDTKTGKNVWPDVAMQLSAIAHAETIVTPDGDERPVPKFEKFAVLHVRPRFAELVPINAAKIEAAWESFKALRVVWEWDQESKNGVLEPAPHISAQHGVYLTQNHPDYDPFGKGPFKIG